MDAHFTYMEVPVLLRGELKTGLWPGQVLAQQPEELVGADALNVHSGENHREIRRELLANPETHLRGFAETMSTRPS